MSEPRRRRFVSGTDVSRCDEECLRTGFCTDFCKVGQDFLTLRQPASEPASEPDREEAAWLDAVSRAFPDFDFSGCYDADDLRTHLQGQVDALREELATAEAEGDRIRELWTQDATMLRDERDQQVQVSLDLADQRDRLATALGEIAGTDFSETSDFSELGRIARAALAAAYGDTPS